MTVDRTQNDLCRGRRPQRYLPVKTQRLQRLDILPDQKELRLRIVLEHDRQKQRVVRFVIELNPVIEIPAKNMRE